MHNHPNIRNAFIIGAIWTLVWWSRYARWIPAAERTPRDFLLWQGAMHRVIRANPRRSQGGVEISALIMIITVIIAAATYTDAAGTPGNGVFGWSIGTFLAASVVMITCAWHRYPTHDQITALNGTYRQRVLRTVPYRGKS